MQAERWFSVNCRPSTAAVAVCLDGCEPDHLDSAIAAGGMPALETVIANGTSQSALSVIRSFTNPNNLSIVAGRPPAVHRICGNCFCGPEEDAEAMVNDIRLLRAQAVFSAARQAGAGAADCGRQSFPLQ